MQCTPEDDQWSREMTFSTGPWPGEGRLAFDPRVVRVLLPYDMPTDADGFCAGRPALTRHRFGEGTAYYWVRLSSMAWSPLHPTASLFSPAPVRSSKENK
jgi:hypothetical protein